MKKLVYVLVAATTWLLASCGEAFFEDDILPTSTKSGLDSQENNNMGEYLSISSNSPDKWTDNDFISFSLAVERIGVTFKTDKQRYEFSTADGNNINVSDTLYNMVIQMFEHTNMIYSKYNKKISRTKSRNGEYSIILPDCVPAAIAHMGRHAPSYAAVIARCDELYPNWRYEGGLPESYIGPLINEYASVIPYYNMNFCTASENSLNNYVMLFTLISHHAVNAYRCVKLGSVLIHYHDYSFSSAGDGVIFESQLDKIFPFVEDLILYH